MKICRLLIAASAALTCTNGFPAAPGTDDAARFGELETAFSAALSADGSRLVFTGPADGPTSKAVVVDLQSSNAVQIARGDNKPLNLRACDWTAADRLVCQLYGTARVDGIPLPVSRTISMNADGTKQIPLGQRNTNDQIGIRQFDGFIVDLLNGVDGAVLMARNNLVEQSTGKLTARTADGLSVDRLDTRTGKATLVERPSREATSYISDGTGNIRVMTKVERAETGDLEAFNEHLYRTAGDRDWKPLGKDDDNGNGTIPLAVDPIVNAAYVLEKLDGRHALYRVALDGSLKKELVYASKEVDISDVVRMGRSGRVIGATYSTDRPQVEYFDPAYRALAAQLAKALPQLPLIQFLSASADEQILLMWAGSDTDPGHFYIFDRQKKTLAEIVPSRPALKGKTLSPVKPVSYTAADGTKIPGYLTLPPGVTEAKGLPAIVMPHGGPSARDEWGFDWLSQFFAQRGFVVLQPNFRGSAGYGDNWLVENGFRNWKTAIGDVADAGRWLVSQGMADPSKLAIFGWSYGGYAALQVNVLDPSLFKAVIAVAPVTDMEVLKAQAERFTNSRRVNSYIGSGPHLSEGSPAQHPEGFQAPVLMFHGDMDVNVDVAHSRRMDKALKGAGKKSDLVVYPNLEHSLIDGDVRADMLRKSEAFLRSSLKL